MTIIVTKEIDEQGRIQLPKELRREMKWSQGDFISIFKSDNFIILDLFEKAKEQHCSICSKLKCIMRIDDFGFCESCVELMKYEIEDIGQHINLNTHSNV